MVLAQRPAATSRRRRRRFVCPRRCKSAPARNHHPMKSCRAVHRSPAFLTARGPRKSSPACRCPMCCWHWRRRARHRARPSRRPAPGHEGSNSPAAIETPGWHRAAGQAGRSGRRPGADRAASCRGGRRRGRAARDAPASRAVRWARALAALAALAARRAARARFRARPVLPAWRRPRGFRSRAARPIAGQAR